MDYLEAELPTSGFLVEDRLTLADIAVICALANLRHHPFSLVRWPKIAAYSKRMLDQPCFAGGLAKERALFAV